MEGTSIFERSVIAWWYGEAFKRMLVFWGRFLVYLADLFSAKACLITFFFPWKRDLLSYQGLSIQQKFEVLVLNLTSRFVGAMIKLFTLLTFCLVFLAAFLAVGLLIVIWLLYPLLLATIFYLGFKIISAS